MNLLCKTHQSLQSNRFFKAPLRPQPLPEALQLKSLAESPTEETTSPSGVGVTGGFGA